MFKDLIEGFVKDQIKHQITETVGIQEDRSDSIIHDVIGSLIGGLANNIHQPEGATSLIHALDKDHDGSLLDDVGDIVARNHQGDKIANHIFGDKLEGISTLIGGKNGIDKKQALHIITTLAPVVMAYLGKKKQDNNWGIDDIVNLLNNEKVALTKDNAEKPLVAFLDTDGDGDIDIMDFLHMRQ